jgi:hypothetical protein
MTYGFLTIRFLFLRQIAGSLEVVTFRELITAILGDQLPSNAAGSATDITDR